MPEFLRAESLRWQVEVPGARWLRADLHVHTLDDEPGGRVQWGGRHSGVVSETVVAAYAKATLQTAIARGIEIIGLTPHAIHAPGQPGLSAVWAVVDLWNSGVDDDGIPFRDKVRAVYPGFEPKMADGGRGVHLLFLFDPEIGQEGLTRAFNAVMDGAEPWTGNALSVAGKSAADAFASLNDMSSRTQGRWQWICLAPHAFNSDVGLLGQLKSQMLQNFEHGSVAALELGDNQLPDDVKQRKPWLESALAKYHQCLIHASDAYILNPNPAGTALFELGSRPTAVKLASPRVEALRQAMLAGDSRISLLFARQPGTPDLVPTPGPESMPASRPWLRTVRVSGGTSFFGGHTESGERTTTIRLNPDFNCIIGGRMSGKSTLLDGLRVALNFPMPTDARVRSDVEGRANSRFLSGSPSVELDICGPVNPTRPPAERWPALFYTQRELQQAVADDSGLRQLLFALSPGRSAQLNEQFSRISDLSAAMGRLVPPIGRATELKGEADQALATADASRTALARYHAVGADRLTQVQSAVGRMGSFATQQGETLRAITTAQRLIAPLTLPSVESPSGLEVVSEAQRAEIAALLATAAQSLANAYTAVHAVGQAMDGISQRLSETAQRLRSELETALAKAGGTAEELGQFASMSASAETYEACRLAASESETKLVSLQAEFDDARREREGVRSAHRQAMLEVVGDVETRFGGRIRVRVVPDGVDGEFNDWVAGLRERGVTRWWNDVEKPLSPEVLLGKLRQDRLGDVGMSDQVSTTFTEKVTEQARLRLESVHTPDRYVLELMVAEGQYRPLEQLSGGQQVSLVLSLLLETDDTRPLVIDQPEDELDRAYMFGTVLPALRSLKGQRQVIFVTHDANIVVNGDADHVTCLEADASSATVAAHGAIDEPEVRSAIIRILDGGRDAFELRALKYGF